MQIHDTFLRKICTTRSTHIAFSYRAANFTLNFNGMFCAIATQSTIFSYFCHKEAQPNSHGFGETIWSKCACARVFNLRVGWRASSQSERRMHFMSESKRYSINFTRSDHIVSPNSLSINQIHIYLLRGFIHNSQDPAQNSQ